MDRLLLSYYGDDLTGSTDVMEALASAGVSTILFLRVPDPALLARFSGFDAIGLAGTSRSETPEWMDENLPSALMWLRSLQAAVCHYKVCSTFDSSPGTGSIGRAVEIGRRIFGQRAVPIVVGAPQLKRYTAFGNLFAAYGGATHRIDRHPVMSRHPVTPMHEADLLAHLAHQTALPRSLIDLAHMRSHDLDELVDRACGEGGLILFDVADPETQKLAGEQLWRLAAAEGPFCCGSSGVEYALVSEWREKRLLAGAPSFPSLPAVDRLAVVSGSVSPTTEAQIRFACENGFTGVALDPLALSGERSEAAVADAVAKGLEILGMGRSVVLYTALGPGADRGEKLDAVAGARHRLGRALGRILERLVDRAELTRAVIAGGDTSSHALAELGVDALSTRMPLPQTPGSPLCRAHSSIPRIDRLEVALKGGQIGLDNYFCVIRDGGS